MQSLRKVWHQPKNVSSISPLSLIELSFSETYSEPHTISAVQTIESQQSPLLCCLFSLPYSLASACQHSRLNHSLLAQSWVALRLWLSTFLLLAIFFSSFGSILPCLVRLSDFRFISFISTSLELISSLSQLRAELSSVFSKNLSPFSDLFLRVH